MPFNKIGLGLRLGHNFMSISLRKDWFHY